MQINLPDHPNIVSHANAAGFASVEDYVLHLVEQNAGLLQSGRMHKDQNAENEAWNQRFDELLASVEPGNPNFDDSRESIYPARGND